MQRKRKQQHVMFDWQATQTQPCLFSTLSKGVIDILHVTRVYACVIQNTQVLRSCVHYVIQNAHFEG